MKLSGTNHHSNLHITMVGYESLAQYWQRGKRGKGEEEGRKEEEEEEEGGGGERRRSRGGGRRREEGGGGE